MTFHRHRSLAITIGVLALLGMVAAFGTAPETRTEAVPQRDFQQELASMPVMVPEQAGSSDYFVHEEQVHRGDTAAALLGRLGVADDETLRQLRTSPEFGALFRQLQPGRTITARTDPNGALVALTSAYSASPTTLVVERQGDVLRLIEQAIVLEPEVVMKAGTIRFSLFGATDAAGIPDSIATKLADIFGGDIDFHRDLREGDRFSVVYESYRHLGRTVRTGRILAAEFVNDGKSSRAVWYSGPFGSGYYTPDGKSLQKTFLRSPLEFSRVTSGFTSARYHPVLQEWRAHRGVDYAAAVGTRVRATADGIVEFVGMQGGYGKVIVLRHQGRYSTVYGHLSRFGPGIRQGARVSQGDVIALSGATGLVSGPHLHYEFRVDGVFKNPLTVALPGAPSVQAAQMAQFSELAELRLSQLQALRSAHSLALLD